MQHETEELLGEVRHAKPQGQKAYASAQQPELSRDGYIDGADEGQSVNAIPRQTELLREGQMLGARMGQLLAANAEQTELPGEATSQLPQGQTDRASSRQTDCSGEANLEVPQGHQHSADPLHPHSDGKASFPVPQGRSRRANPSLTDCSGEAIVDLPQGHAQNASPLQTPSLTDGSTDVADKAGPTLPDVSETIDDIRAAHRKRVFAMETRKRADLALGAYLRSWMGWRKDNDKDLNERIKDAALKLIECGEKVAKQKQANHAVPKKAKSEAPVPAHPLVDTEEWQAYGEIILAAIASRDHTDILEEKFTKKMEKLAASLPVWDAFGKGIKGFGARSLAVIVGEAGDLSAYPKKGHLWKRMGLAPFVKNGVARSGHQWRTKGGLTADEWKAFGYSPKRRSVMYVIGETMVKHQSVYREVYLQRKDYLKARAEAAGLQVVPSAKIPKGKQAEYVSAGEIHAQSLYYMEKQLLRDLHRAWRAESQVPVMAEKKLPADSIDDAA